MAVIRILHVYGDTHIAHGDDTHNYCTYGGDMHIAHTKVNYLFIY